MDPGLTELDVALTLPRTDVADVDDVDDVRGLLWLAQPATAAASTAADANTATLNTGTYVISLPRPGDSGPLTRKVKQLASNVSQSSDAAA